MFYPTRKEKLLDIAGVKAGGTAIINCPTGPRYRAIIIEGQNSAAGDAHGPGTSFFGEISVIVGSKVIRRMTGDELDLLNKTNGAQYGAISVDGAANGGGVTRLPIFFEEPWRKKDTLQEGLALQTGWMSNKDVLQIRVPIAAGVTPVLTAYAIVDDFYDGSGKPNKIMKWDRNDLNTNGSTVDKSNLFNGFPADDLISALSFFDPSDSVAQSKEVIQARLEINKVAVYDDITRDELDALQEFYDMAANPAGVFSLVFDHDDLFESMRPVGNISASQLKLTLAAASNGTMSRIIQSFGTPV